jgi:hypothetical protein
MAMLAIMPIAALRERLGVWVRGLPVSAQIGLALAGVGVATVAAWLAGWTFGQVVGAIVRGVSARFGLDRAIQ